MHCEFIDGMKMVQIDIWKYYNVIKISFKVVVFIVFNNLINFWNVTLSLMWVVNLGFLKPNFVSCMHFDWAFELAWLHVENWQTRQMDLISPTMWEQNFKECEDIMFWSNISPFLWTTTIVLGHGVHDNYGHYLPPLVCERWW